MLIRDLLLSRVTFNEYLEGSIMNNIVLKNRIKRYGLDKSKKS